MPIQAITNDATSLEPSVSGLSGAVAWLRKRDVSVAWIAEHFRTTPNHVRQLAHRGSLGRANDDIPPVLTYELFPPQDPFELPQRAWLGPVCGIRGKPNKLGLTRKARARIQDLEEQIETFGTTFWSHVRFADGVDPLLHFEEQLGYPSHYRFVRVLARLHQLLSENHVHVGFARSAIKEGLKSIHLSRFAYHDSGESRFDLEQIAKTALLISQACLLRMEGGSAEKYLDLYEAATERARLSPGGEYFRQRGVVRFQSGQDDAARPCFEKAAIELAHSRSYGKDRMPHEVLNIGQRQTNLLGTPDWDQAQELFDYMLKHLAPGEIHISMNLNWAAATAFATDSASAQRRAMELLDEHFTASEGYGHQRTIAKLLRMTVDLPSRLRSTWVRRSLYENAFARH